jgi:dTDP-4-dehydrorhamnose 3,5-epimerase
MKSVTGCLVFKNKHFADKRGCFIEAYSKSGFEMIPEIVQTNVSVSHRNVVRGMHAQRHNPQGKLVRVLSGVALDVVVDARDGSPTFGKVEQFLLQPGGISVFIPPGFLHGFWAMTDECVFHYGCTAEYDSKSDGGVNPLDDSLALPWNGCSDIIVSDKDKALPSFDDYVSEWRLK